MARVRYQDSDGRSGDVEHARVRVGDVVRVLADFVKMADGAEATIARGELAEVVRVQPFTVEALTTLRGHTKPRRVQVSLRDVLLLLDSRDPRVNAHRRRLASRTDWLPLILWVFEETQDPAEARLTQKDHVLAALDEFHAPTGSVALLLAEARDAVEEMSQADWEAVLPRLEEYFDLDDKAFHEAYAKWTDAEILEVAHAGDSDADAFVSAPHDRSQSASESPNPTPRAAPFFEPDNRSNHGWGLEVAQVPLTAPPGFFRGNATHKVWAAVGLQVEHVSSGVVGEVVRILADGRLEVQVSEPKRKRVYWAADEVQVSPEEEGAAFQVTPAELAAWRASRT